jgi:DNA polymerase-3 subunit epsilon
MSELFGYGQLGPDGYPLDGVPYVVIDLETTGLEPAEDRIIEIAMGRVENGQLVDEWATLISADRDPGPVFLHHISEGMLAGAPSFRDIAGEILGRLDGAIVVAHHAPFEESFLAAELARLGIDTAPMPALCTRQLAKAVLAAPNYKLATCCEISGISITDAHTALDEAAEQRSGSQISRAADTPAALPAPSHSANQSHQSAQGNRRLDAFAAQQAALLNVRSRPGRGGSLS